MHTQPTAVMLSTQAFPTIYPFQYILFSKIFSLIPLKHFIFASLLKNELFRRVQNFTSVKLQTEWQFSWLEYVPVTHGVAGSSPVRSAETSQIERFFLCTIFPFSGFEFICRNMKNEFQFLWPYQNRFNKCHFRGAQGRPACRRDTQIEFSWS